LQDSFEAAGKSLKMRDGCEELDPLLHSWLSAAIFLEDQASAANTAVGSLPSFWSLDVILFTSKFFIEVALTDITLHADKH
jgi:hypothetical protein